MSHCEYQLQSDEASDLAASDLANDLQALKLFEALVVINCVVVLVLLVTALRSIGRMGVELRELQLTFVDDKTVVQLPMLNNNFATHLCETARSTRDQFPRQ